MVKGLSFAALVTAAGASSRMGQPKALVPWRGVPLLQHQARVLAQVPAIGENGEIVVVLGGDADIIAAAAATWPEAERLRIVKNPLWSEGRSTSIAAGVRGLSARPELGLLVVAVDQPLDLAVVEALIAVVPADGEVVVPSFEGRRGHPVVIAASLMDQVGEVADASRYPEGLRSIVRAARVREVPVGTAAIFANLNTPADVERAG